jgi:hypothetical protein
MVRAAELMAAVDGKRAALLKGAEKPKSPAERLALARVCQARQLYRAAAQSYAGAFTTQPALETDLDAGNRFDAACCAARAGTGQGKDAGKLGEQDRAGWRKQALGWLRADLSVFVRTSNLGGPEVSGAVRRELQRWSRDPDFAGVRGPAALAKLPQVEQKSWQQFWTEVETLLRKLKKEMRR